MHGDLSETATVKWLIHWSRLLTGSVLADLSHNHGDSTARAATRCEVRKRPTGATPPTFSCNCWLAGPVPLRF
jgi:hypothetical protein